MTIEEQLIGTSWELVTYQSANKFGDVLFPLGEDAKGMIAFTTDKQTSVHIMAADRENRPSEEELSDYNTEAEMQMARLGYHAYTGPFTIDEDASVLTTHVTLSLIADYVNSEQSRSASIDGDILRLSNIKHPERKLEWKKIVK